MTGPSITSRRRKDPVKDPIRGYWYLQVGFILIAASAIAAVVFVVRRIHEAIKS